MRLLDAATANGESTVNYKIEGAHDVTLAVEGTFDGGQVEFRWRKAGTAWQSFAGAVAVFTEADYRVLSVPRTQKEDPIELQANLTGVGASTSLTAHVN